MTSDQIRYDLLTQKALLDMVRDLLTEVAKKGLPGDHHFFIAFNTLADGVKLSQRIRAQYPEEMTIVLQHQFWDLTVSDDRFEVGLSFNGIPERLSVPFSAIKGFFDPSVQFGLQFEEHAADEAAPRKPEPGKPETGKLEAVKPETAKGGEASKPAAVAPEAKPRPAARPVPLTPATPPTPSTEGEHPKPAGGGEVVSLDRFRKK
jgi:uncharacterized protein